jgi:hypothetical protein
MSMTTNATTELMLTMPCPEHAYIAAGTKCPAAPSARAGRVGCQARLVLAQAVVNGTLPKAKVLNTLSLPTRTRMESTFKAAQAAGLMDVYTAWTLGQPSHLLVLDMTGAPALAHGAGCWCAGGPG